MFSVVFDVISTNFKKRTKDYSRARWHWCETNRTPSQPSHPAHLHTTHTKLFHTRLPSMNKFPEIFHLKFIFFTAGPKLPVWSPKYTHAAGNTAASPSTTARIVEKRVSRTTSPLSKAASVSLFIRNSWPACRTVILRSFRPRALLQAPQHSAAGSTLS